jgi:hypothetical protein
MLTANGKNKWGAGQDTIERRKRVANEVVLEINFNYYLFNFSWKCLA